VNHLTVFYSFKGGNGPFCSDHIAIVFAKHLGKIKDEGERYGPQIGGLALATAAVSKLAISVIRASLGPSS
jgi:hypothetical protein